MSIPAQFATGVCQPANLPVIFGHDGRRLIAVTTGDWNNGEVYRLTRASLELE